MTSVTEIKSNTSDAILSSLFDDIATGKAYFDVEQLQVPTTISDSMNGPSASSAKVNDDQSSAISKDDGKISADKRDSKKDTERLKSGGAFLPKIPAATKSSSDGSTITKKEPKLSRVSSGIKIVSLKDSTRLKIADSTDKNQQQQHGKFSEEGEILPSDIGSDDSESDGNEFNIGDETDGELKSDNEEKEKKRKKKKKHKHDHERHKKRKHGKSRKSETQADEEISSSKRKRRIHEKSQSRSLERQEIQEIQDRNDRIVFPKVRQPFEKMLDFHLNLKQRRESSYRSDYARYSRPNGPRSNSALRESYRDRSSIRDRDSRRIGRGFHVRTNETPGARLYSRVGPGKSEFRSRASASPRRNDRYERSTGREASRSRSRHRSRSRDRKPPFRVESSGKPLESSKTTTDKIEVDDERIDKRKLYEIARKNAAAMIKSGELQQHLSNLSTEDLMKLRSGGKSMEDLIAYCRKLQKKEEKREAGDASSDEDNPKKHDEDELDVFIRHPYLLKPQTGSFVFNVKNVIQIPVKTPAERAADDAKLKLTFPVSSGEQHRGNELEWVPVTPSEKAPEKGKNQATKPSKLNAQLAIEYNLPPPPSPPPALSFIPPPPPPPPVVQQEQPMEQAPVDIGEVVNSRLKAIRRLNENSNDVEAMKLVQFAEEQLKRWAESKNIPGLFTESTSVGFTTPEEVAPSGVRLHAWAKKDTLISAKPVSSGVGMHLLQKMGWRPGEGLGKNRGGALEPLSLEVKSDRKGLLASEEGPSQRIRATAVKDFQGKHPVSALMELCSRRKWGLPDFKCVEAGPSHDRRFTWKAIVNGVEYQAATPANNKKSGKAQVCQIVLQSLGLLPRDKSLPIVIG